MHAFLIFPICLTMLWSERVNTLSTRIQLGLGKVPSMRSIGVNGMAGSD